MRPQVPTATAQAPLSVVAGTLMPCSVRTDTNQAHVVSADQVRFRVHYRQLRGGPLGAVCMGRLRIVTIVASNTVTRYAYYYSCMSEPTSASGPKRRATEAAESLAAEGLAVTSRAVRARAGVSMAVATEAATTWNERVAAQLHIPEVPESVTARFGGIWREAYAAARDAFAAEREALTGRLRAAEEENKSLADDLTTSDARVAELEAALARAQTDAAQAVAAHAAELSAERSRGDRAEGALDAVTTERDRLLKQIETVRPPADG